MTELKAPQRPAASTPQPRGPAPKALSIVERAACPAAATDPDNRIVAWNTAFAELAGTDDLVGNNLQELLRCRHPNGNSLSQGHNDLHEMVLSGEAPAAFEIDVEPEGRPRVRVEVSIVVVFDNGNDGHRLVYLMRPRLRRRRIDTAIDQLLCQSGPVPNRRASDREPPILTRRQLQVLRLMAKGETATEISAELGIATNTVRTHIRAIFETLGVTRQTEAVAKALRDRMI